MNLINDNLINSVIRLRVSFEMGLFDYSNSNTNTTELFNLNRIFQDDINRNNIIDRDTNTTGTFYRGTLGTLYSGILRADDTVDRNNLFQSYDINATTNLNEEEEEELMDLMNTISNSIQETLITSIISRLMNVPDSENVNSDSILSEDEFNHLNSYIIKKENICQCSICLEDFNVDETAVSLNCNHVYHKECIKEWLTKQSSKCPTCRTCCKNV